VGDRSSVYTHTGINLTYACLTDRTDSEFEDLRGIKAPCPASYFTSVLCLTCCFVPQCTTEEQEMV